jgi:hypothetical protein
MHRDEIPRGTLHLLILKTLARSGEMLGYEIANSIQRVSNDVLTRTSARPQASRSAGESLDRQFVRYVSCVGHRFATARANRLDCFVGHAQINQGQTISALSQDLRCPASDSLCRADDYGSSIVLNQFASRPTPRARHSNHAVLNRQSVARSAEWP